MPRPKRKAQENTCVEEDDERTGKRVRSSRSAVTDNSKNLASTINLSNTRSRGSDSSHKTQNNSSSGARTKMNSTKSINSAKSFTENRVPDDTSAFSSKRCQTWFSDYAVKTGEQIIDPEGMEKFCEDIGVEPENIVMLALAYKLNADQMGYFTQEEWLRGMSGLQCDSTTKLRNKLDYLRSLFTDPSSFKLIYRYAFDFAKNSGSRCMDIDIAVPMLSLLLGKKWSLFSHFSRFIEGSSYKVLNRDQWLNIYEFSLNISSDLSNYDEDGAWPVLLDEFVNFVQGNP